MAVNEAAIESYRYCRSEFLSMTLRDIRPRENISAVEDSISRNPEYPGKIVELINAVWRTLNNRPVFHFRPF